jgi:hypothetical protein
MRPVRESATAVVSQELDLPSTSEDDREFVAQACIDGRVFEIHTWSSDEESPDDDDNDDELVT